MKYKIEKNVTIPSSTAGYPIDQMEVGDSFLVPMKERNKLNAAIMRFKAKKGYGFKTRSVSKVEIRVWRTL